MIGYPPKARRQMTGSMITRRLGLIIRVAVVVAGLAHGGRRRLVSSSSLNVEDLVVGPPVPEPNSVRKVSVVSCRKLSKTWRWSQYTKNPYEYYWPCRSSCGDCACISTESNYSDSFQIIVPLEQFPEASGNFSMPSFTLSPSSMSR